MLIFSRRFQSTLVKAQASNALNNVIAEKKTMYDMESFSTEHMKEYFDQNGLSIPVDTIIEKYKAEDYDFFLERGNFLKVADTLEKFENNLDMEHEEAKDFVLFKRKLYKIYEVRSRSLSEHAEFSTEILENELTHVYGAHKHHLATMMRENHLERWIQQSNLKGAFYKRKLMSPQRVKGVGSWAFALGFYIYSPYLWPYFAVTALTAKLHTITPIAAALYGVYNLSESNTVHAIERLSHGSDAGKIRLSIAVTPFITRDILAEAQDIHDGGNIGKLGISALKVTKGYDLHTRSEFDSERVYTIDTSDEGNAWVDSEGMDWLLQKKDTSSKTDDLYADLVHQRARDIANSKRERRDFLTELRYVVEK